MPSGSDQIWVADITYVHLARGFAYLAVILDAFSRKAVGWALAQNLQASLAVTALTQALDTRKPASGSLIHHSDRGVQYASLLYRPIVVIRFMVDGSSVGSINGPSMAHQMPLAGAVHHIAVNP